MPHAERITPELLRSWPLPQPDEGGDKASRGQVRVIGGAAATPGALLLSGIAALRVGAGKLSITTVVETATSLAVAVPEARVDGVASEQGMLLRCDVEPGADAYVVGPGILDPGELVACVLPACADAGLVIDAVALHDLPEGLADRTVLTPNLKELRSLAGRDDSVSALARDVAAARQAVVVTQGWVAAPDGTIWHDDSGSVALATSGSGDVLAGVVGGLLARGAEPAQAGCWGHYLHGQAGRRKSVGTVGLLARELLEELPHVLALLERPQGEAG
ncbi:MAG: NAD(P)H-hydrate dehydratase [Mycobacteriales bacterium]